MRPHHAAALALVGWYLMLPLAGHRPGSYYSYYDPTAPLSAWLTVHVFDTAEECNAALRELRKDAQKEDPDFFARLAAAKLTPGQRKTVKESLEDGRCIASDDPRLKEK